MISILCRLDSFHYVQVPGHAASGGGVIDKKPTAFEIANNHKLIENLKIWGKLTRLRICSDESHHETLSGTVLNESEQIFNYRLQSAFSRNTRFSRLGSRKVGLLLTKLLDLVRL